MKKILKKYLLVVLVLAIVVSNFTGAAFAATLNNGDTEDDRCIYLSMAYTDAEGKTPVTTLKKDDSVCVFLNFGNNPTELKKSIQAIQLFVKYDPTKFQPTDFVKGDVEPVVNTEYDKKDKNIVFVTWADNKGISVTDSAAGTSSILEKGSFAKLSFKALTDVTEEDLKAITYLPSYTDDSGKVLNTYCADGTKKAMPTVALPDLKVEMSKTEFDKNTPFVLIEKEIKAVTYTHIDTDGSAQAEAVTGYTAKLKGEGALTKENNILTVDYEGCSAEVELKVSDNEYTKEDAGVTAQSVTTSYGKSASVTAGVKTPGLGTGEYTWTVEAGDDVIKLTEDGDTATVKPLKAGNATVKAAYESETAKGEATLAVTVNKAEVTVDTKADPEIVKAGGEAPKFTYTVDGLVDEDTIESLKTGGDFKLKAVTAEDSDFVDTETPGEYKVVFVNKPEFGENDKYNVTVKETGKFTVTKKDAAEVTVTGAINGHKYGDRDFRVTASANVSEEGTYSWSVTKGQDVIELVPDGASATVRILKAGEAEITASFVSDSYAGSGVAKLAIAPANVTVKTTVDRTTVKVGGDAPTLSHSVTGMVTGDDINDFLESANDFAVEGVAEDGTKFTGTAKEGKYTVKFVKTPEFKKDNGKYEFKVDETASFEVMKKEEATVTISSKTSNVTYGGREFTLTARVSGVKNETGDYRWEITEGDNVIELANTQQSTVTVRIKNAGTAKIAVTFESANYFGRSEESTVTVGKATLTARAGTYEVFQGRDFPEMKATYSGFVSEDSVDNVPELGRLTLKAVDKDNVPLTDTNTVGSYNVKFFDGGVLAENFETANYKVSFQNGTLRVKNKSDARVSLSGVSSSYTYGAGPLNFYAKASYTGENGHFTWESEDPSVVSLSYGENGRVVATFLRAGTSKVTATYTSDTTSGSASVTIRVSKANVTVDTDSVIVKKGDSMPALTCSAKGLVNGDTLTGELAGSGCDLTLAAYENATPVADTSKAGTYTVRFVERKTGRVETDRYIFTFRENGTLKVVDKEPTDVQIVGLTGTYTYGDNSVSIAANVANPGTGTTSYTWTSSDPTVAEVTGSGRNVAVKFLKSGTTTISVLFESSTNFGLGQCTISVGKAPLVVRPMDTTIGAGAAMPVIEIYYDGLVSSDKGTEAVVIRGDLDSIVFVDANGRISTTVNTRAMATYTMRFADTIEFLGSDKYIITTGTGEFSVKPPKPGTTPAPGVVVGPGGSSGSAGGTGNGTVNGQYVINASTTAGGKISPTGTVYVDPGKSVDFTITPDKGFEIADVVVDGLSIGKVNTYRFADVEGNHSIMAKFTRTAVESEIPFLDVSDTEWYYDDVVYVYSEGLMEGVSEYMFAPGMTNTRGMLVTILYRLEGKPGVSPSNFTDVSSGAYYADAVAWAASHGIVTGYGDGRFGPNDSLTREQMVTILYRYSEYKGYDTSTGSISGFADAEKVNGYAVDAMKWAVSHGIIQGVGGNSLSPAGTSTRDQLAAVLHRFCEMTAK